jgi:GGDEF domain-containing protein
LVAFTLVLRTGWNRRFADPALTEAQMWVGIVLLGWGYLIGGPGRPVALILLFVILMFALLTVTFRQMTRASALAVLVFGAASMGVVGREGALPLTVDLQVLYFCVLLIILSCACVLVRQLSLLRERAAHARHDLAEAMAKLHGQVIRDELTGLFNRRHMHKLLRIEQARADRSGFPWCVAMIDLDLFKRVNDEHGHPVGDEVLRSTAQVLSGGLRGADQVARWGGEEFLVLFPDTDSGRCLSGAGAHWPDPVTHPGEPDRAGAAGHVLGRGDAPSGRRALGPHHRPGRPCPVPRQSLGSQPHGVPVRA